MSVATIRIGPEDQGRLMSLQEFDRAEGREGYRYELSRGVITVTEIARPDHGKVVAKLTRLLYRHFDQQPDQYVEVRGGQDCKILLADLQSERHPDLAVYTSPAPSQDADVWAEWIPDLIVEVVSRDSVHRDYEQKPEEYLAFGVKEYWIIDPLQWTMRVLLRRGGTWREKVYPRGETYESLRMKGLKISVSEILS